MSLQMHCQKVIEQHIELKKHIHVTALNACMHVWGIRLQKHCQSSRCWRASRRVKTMVMAVGRPWWRKKSWWLRPVWYGWYLYLSKHYGDQGQDFVTSFVSNSYLYVRKSIHDCHNDLFIFVSWSAQHLDPRSHFRSRWNAFRLLLTLARTVASLCSM